MTNRTHLTTPESLRRTADNLRRNAHESLIQADEIDALADAIEAGGAVTRAPAANLAPCERSKSNGGSYGRTGSSSC